MNRKQREQKRKSAKYHSTKKKTFTPDNVIVSVDDVVLEDDTHIGSFDVNQDGDLNESNHVMKFLAIALLITFMVLTILEVCK